MGGDDLPCKAVLPMLLLAGEVIIMWLENWSVTAAVGASGLEETLEETPEAVGRTRSTYLLQLYVWQLRMSNVLLLQVASRNTKSLEIARNLAVLESDDPSLFAPPNVRDDVMLAAQWLLLHWWCHRL
jgi:hypothetical protein